ncbi:MAG TPA: glycine--tRNA ligase, partial [archaeon]|nr:glycine--tRNA ligase [archaeon]
MQKENKIEEIARRRGFFWTSSEIYGGLSGFYDYAHLGTLLKNRWENAWRKFFLGLDDNFFEIQPTEIMHEKVWQASGHVESFVDPVVKCKKCGHIERADKLLEEELHET